VMPAVLLFGRTLVISNPRMVGHEGLCEVDR